MSFDKKIFKSLIDEGSLNQLKQSIENDNISVDVLNSTSINEKDDNIFLYASRYGKLKVIKYLVDELKMDINHCNKNGDNALTLAAFNGHLEVLKYLVESLNMNVNHCDEYGDNALHLLHVMVI